MVWRVVLGDWLVGDRPAVFGGRALARGLGASQLVDILS